MSLALAETKSCIDRFLLEAEKCAEQEYGFAAMLTVFSVILGVAEAVINRSRNEELFRWFVSQMGDRSSWIVIPDSSSPTAIEIGKKLAQTRDSLSHQFSLPVDLELVNSIQQVELEPDPPKYYIGTKEFVDAVISTIDKIVQSNGDVEFDSNQRGINRGVANRVVRTGGSPSSSNPSMEGSSSSASVSVSCIRISKERE
jgi:hypothetical protein